MSSNTIYLITGANRGIGLGLVAAYLARPNNTVIAAVRDASNPATRSPFISIPVGPGSKLIIMGIDSSKEDDPAAAIQTLESEYGISHLDVVIANAGISTDFSTVANVPIDIVKKHVEVNAYGPLLLFQAVVPLLEKAKGPKFASIGTPIASITGMESRPFPMAAYAISKVILHWIARKTHLEHDKITSFTIDPGFVQTDMGNSAARAFGMKEAYTTVSDSVNYIVATVDGATKEQTSGHFPSIGGGDFKW